MADAYIKLYRTLLDWEWYGDPNTKIVFLHCLLRANWKPTKWRGVDIDAGQFITSLANLAEETGLTVKQVRTALNHLKSTGEVASKGQSKFRVITVNNWDKWQGKGQAEGKQGASKGQARGKQGATDKEYKEGKEDKEIKHIYGEFKHVKLSDTERDWLFRDFGESDTLAAIKFLDEYKERKGYKSQNDNLTLRKWVFNAVKESQGDTPVNKKIHNYEERHYDFDELARIAKGEK